jgi:hypothetical protein
MAPKKNRGWDNERSIIANRALAPIVRRSSAPAVADRSHPPKTPGAAVSRSKLCVLSDRSEIGGPGAASDRPPARGGMAPMHTESRETRAGGGPRLERAIVLQLLRDDREASWSRQQLLSELGADGVALEQALTALQGEGVLCLSGQAVQASRASRHLDELGLLGI